MESLGIGEVLEKLIYVLQLEGHELFRIFTEVQPAIAICNAIIILFGLVGGVASIALVYKIGKKRGWFRECDVVDIIIVFAIVGIICGVILGVLGMAITDVFLHINYPEYFAAKELIISLGSLTP
ncbi:hypothetical protein KAW18_12695 [candidate division WOR-3 bacterium]|nr:hypothetical protein [candidate division WOR-3 bacterium]